MLSSAAAAAISLAIGRPLSAEAAVVEAPPRVLCDDACMEALEAKEMVTLPSGLQYRDVVLGKGPSPPTGYQVVVHYVAMTPKYRIFDNSLERGAPYDIRVGAGQVVPGLDEGLSSMKVGGIRRLYIPGPLSFPKGLKAAAGRPSVPPATPVVFDVQLLYIPGLEDDDEVLILE